VVVCLYVADAENPVVARREVRGLLQQVLEGIAVRPS
jgi:hypothetical protein